MANARKRRVSIGVDYGTNSVRSIVVDVNDGTVLGSHAYDYPGGVKGILLDPRDVNVARQHPRDYMRGFMVSVRKAVRQAMKKPRFDVNQIVGIGIDSTGSTPLPVDRKGLPLALSRKHGKNLAAMAWLWKDHSSHEEAARITAHAKKTGVPYLEQCGGVYSSEWFWSKIWHCRRVAPGVFKDAYSWVELCDFIPAYITGNLDPRTLKRSVCAAGHKAMFSDTWGGLPDKNFLRVLCPDLARLRDRLYETAVPSDQEAGVLTQPIARKIGVPPGIPVAVGGFDAHHGAIGAGVREGAMVKIMGTSTCDILVAPGNKSLVPIPGICGVVKGSVIPGMYGLEAGQSAVGDIFHWFVTHLCPKEFSRGDAHANLTREARKLTPGENGLIALDWNNGNRTILVDPLLTGLLIGQSLHTTAPEIFRALIEATAYGALAIINRFKDCGVRVREIIACGGIAEKNDFVMQVYADVFNRPVKVSRVPQTCALGAAMFGAIAGGAHCSVRNAQRHMGSRDYTVFKPVRRHAAVYRRMYQLYRMLHDGFGTADRGIAYDTVMKNLIRIRDQARRKAART